MKGVEVNREEKMLQSDQLCNVFGKYLDAVKDLSIHLFNCQWQYDQIAKFKAKLPESTLMCSHDFAKNITCYNQREIQNAFYNHSLVTLHCSVCFHRCERKFCNQLVRHEVIHLTDVLSHTAASFKVFHRDSVKIIESATGLDFGLILNISDQAPSQYKNKNSFLFTSEYHKPIIHVFLGSRHGKYYSDQAAGRFLQFLRREIASDRCHLKCAQDVASIAQKSYATPEVKNECQHFRISINVVQRIWKNPERSVRIEGTRDIHVIRNTGIPGLIDTRNIACLCLPCVSGNGSCENPEFFEEWEARSVARRVSVGGRSVFWPLKIIEKNKSNENCNGVDRNTENINNGTTTAYSVLKNKERDCSNIDNILNNDPHLQYVQTEKTVHARLSKFCGLPVCQTKVSSWSKVLKDMEALSDYDDLVQYCANLSIPPIPTDFKGNYAASNVDKLTLKFVKTFPSDYFPIKVSKDGNCFPRAISKIVFNTESQHQQIRVRLLKEAIVNKDKYLNNDYLRKGVDHLAGVDLVQHYSTYSDKYNSSMTLDDVTVHQIFKTEWFEYRLLGSYSGAYQIHSASTVIQSWIRCHYPLTSIQSINKDLNRSFYPVSTNDERNLKICHIQWTKSSENSIRLEHFVPLLQKKK